MYIEVIDMLRIFRRNKAKENNVFAMDAEDVKLLHCQVRDDVPDIMPQMRHYDEWNLQRFYDLNPRYVR